MNGLRIAEAATFGDLHRIDIADQVAHGGIGCREFLGIAFAAVPPGDGQTVTELGGQPPALRADRFQRMFAQLGARDHRGPFVE